MLRQIVFCCSTAALLGSSCGQNQTLSGSINQIKDAVLVDCHTYPIPNRPLTESDKHTCLVYADSTAQQLGVFDVSIAQFVLNSSGYSGLAGQVGEQTSRLAAKSSVSPFVYALDVAENKIFATRTLIDININQTSFGTPTAIDLAAGQIPLDIAVMGNSPFVALIASTTGLQVIEIEPTTGQPKQLSTLNKQFAVGPLSTIAVDPDENFVLLAQQGSTQIRVLSTSQILQPSSTMSLDSGFTVDNIESPIRKMAIGTLNGQAVAVILRDSLNADLRKIDLSAKSAPLLATLTFSAQPKTVYFPKDSPAMVNNSTSWLAVVTEIGTLEYTSLATVQFSGPVTTIATATTATLSADSDIPIYTTEEVLLSSAIAGGQIRQSSSTCGTRLVLLAFGTGMLASICEGNIKLTIYNNYN